MDNNDIDLSAAWENVDPLWRPKNVSSHTTYGPDPFYYEVFSLLNEHIKNFDHSDKSLRGLKNYLRQPELHFAGLAENSPYHVMALVRTALDYNKGKLARLILQEASRYVDSESMERIMTYFRFELRMNFFSVEGKRIMSIERGKPGVMFIYHQGPKTR